MHFPLLISSGLCLLRVIAIPLSKVLGVKDRNRIRAPSIPKLEAFYKQHSQQPSQVGASQDPPTVHGVDYCNYGTRNRDNAKKESLL